MTLYKFLSDDCVMHTESRRAIYLNQSPTIHTEAYFKWVADGNVADPADPLSAPAFPPRNRADEIKAELAAIDQKSIRAIRENDAVRVAQWESQAQALRTELAGL